MEDFLKLAVNYGLGMFFAIGISITFFLYAREKDKQSYARELALMHFMEEHSLKTQKMVEDNINRQMEVAKFQKQEHESIMAGLALINTAIGTYNNNLISFQKHQINN